MGDIPTTVMISLFLEEPLQFPKQAEFPDEPKIISVSGHPGSYYVTDQNGQAYVWEVDSSVKFKPEKTKERLSQRIVECSKYQLMLVQGERISCQNSSCSQSVYRHSHQQGTQNIRAYFRVGIIA